MKGGSLEDERTEISGKHSLNMVESFFLGVRGEGYFWEVVVGVHRPALLIFYTISENIFFWICKKIPYLTVTVSFEVCSVLDVFNTKKKKT